MEGEDSLTEKGLLKFIKLTHDDPIERLFQFCQQGGYNPRFTFESFQNGVMCELEVSKGGENILAKEVRFVQDKDVSYAQKVVAAILLEKIGLGVIEEEPSAGDRIQEMAEKSMDFAMTALTKLLSGDQ